MSESNLEKLERLETLSDGRKGLRGALNVECRAAEGGKPIIEFVASDASLDRYDEVIDASGWELANYQKNPVFQNAHRYGDIIFTLGRSLLTEVRIGKVGTLSTASPYLFQRIEFATEINPMAKIAYGLYRGGFLNAVSVGFIPLEWENGSPQTPGGSTPYRRKYLKQELLELSAVGIPANPNALQMGLKAGAISKGDLEALVDMLEDAVNAYATGEMGRSTEKEAEADEEAEKEKAKEKPLRGKLSTTREAEKEKKPRRGKLFPQFDETGFGNANVRAPGAEPNGAQSWLQNAKEVCVLALSK